MRGMLASDSIFRMDILGLDQTILVILFHRVDYLSKSMLSLPTSPCNRNSFVTWL